MNNLTNYLKELNLNFKYNYFHGHDIFCPFCKKQFKILNKEDLEFKCPVCESTIKERTFFLFLKIKTEVIETNKNVLVISENNIITKEICNNDNITYIEYHHDKELNLFKNNYEKGYFDYIICYYTLEKFHNEKFLLGELKRVLSKEGFMIIQSNIDESIKKTIEMNVINKEDRLRVYGIENNYRRYGLDYLDRIRECGLNALKYNFIDFKTPGFKKTIDKKYIVNIIYREEVPKLMNKKKNYLNYMSLKSKAFIRDKRKAILYKYIIRNTINILKYLNLTPGMKKNKIKPETWFYFMYVLFFSAFFILVPIKTIMYLSSIMTTEGTLILLKALFFPISIILCIPIFLGLLTMAGYCFIIDKISNFKKGLMFIILTTISLILGTGGLIFLDLG